MNTRSNGLTNFYAKTFIAVLVTCFAILFPKLLCAQAPNLGTVASYIFFTSSGNFTNNGFTEIIGNIGTDAGALTGFPPGIVIGETHVADPASAQAAIDACAAYSNLVGRTCGSIKGSSLTGQVLTPGVYCIGQAATLGGTLTFDAQNMANALFIVQIDGAFTTSTFSEILLLNGAHPDSIFFQVNGLFTMGDNSIFNGTVITNGAITLLDNATLYGRALACNGAITLNNNTAQRQQTVLPIILSSFSASRYHNKTHIRWTTESEINTKYFIVEHSTSGGSGTWTSKGQTNASGYSTTVKHYTMTDNNPSIKDNYYRLKSVDNDNFYSLSDSKYVSFSKGSPQLINAFPVPFKEVINLTGIEKGSTILLSDMSGKTIRQLTSTGNGIDRINSNNFSTGTYFLKIIAADGETTSIKINK